MTMTSYSQDKEIVKYYAKCGEGATRTSFFCTQCAMKDTESFYDVAIVEEETDVHNRNCFRFSLDGVECLDCNQSMTAEQMTLGAWIQEKCLYRRLIKIDFFKNFRKRKVFRQWVIWTRQKRYKKQTGCLATKLLFARPEVCLLLNRISTAIEHFSDLPLMNILVKSTKAAEMPLVSLSSFIGEEIDFRQTQLVPSLKEVISACQGLLEKHCKSLKAQESLCKDKERQLKASRRLVPGCVAKEEAEDRILRLGRDLRSVTTDLRSCPRLIQLVNYQLAEKLKLLIENSIENLIACLSTKQVFILDIELSEDGLILTPSEAEIKKALKDFISSFSEISNLVYIISLPDAVREDISTTKTCFDQVLGDPLVSSHKLQESQEKLDEIIASSFEICEKAAGSCLQILTAINNKCAYDSEADEVPCDKSCTLLKADLQTLNSSKEQLEQIPTCTSGGCLVLNFASVKQSTQIKLQQTLDESRSLLINTTKQNCLKLIDVLGGTILEMEERPHELPAFVALSQRLNKAWQTLVEVEDEIKDIEEGFLILLDCGATMSPLDQITLEQLHEVQAIYGGTLEEATEYVKERQPRMLNLIQKDQKQIKDSIKNLHLTDEERNLAGHSSEIKELKTRLKSLEHFEEQLVQISHISNT